MSKDVFKIGKLMSLKEAGIDERYLCPNISVSNIDIHNNKTTDVIQSSDMSVNKASDMSVNECSLVQLVAYGLQDAYLTEKPTIYFPSLKTGNTETNNKEEIKKDGE